MIDIKKAGSGLIVRVGDKRYAIDKVPSSAAADVYLVSHAHIDHLPRIQTGLVVASRETIELASERGYKYLKYTDEYRDIELIDSGHILGSKSFLINGKILYTGDVNLHDRLFLKGFKPIEADILIIEATYGHPKYIFGDFNKLAERLLMLTSTLLLQGKSVILKAYPLGKLQLLIKLLDITKNIYVSKEVYRFNKVYRKLGYLDYTGRLWSNNLEEPFILLCSRSEYDLISTVKNEYNAVEILLSGWAINIEDDFGIPMSDHADFSDLLNIIEAVNPKKIYTIYGYSSYLASYLRKLGYDAEELT